MAGMSEQTASLIAWPSEPAATMVALVPDAGTHGRVRHAEVAVPSPGAGELLVAVAAFSINRGETFQLEAPPADWRPGKDAAGTVLALGDGVAGIAVGDRVVVHADAGTWAEQVAVPRERVALLPEGVELESATTLGLAGLPALRLTRATGPLAGRRVLLTGASGGVGHGFVQLAAAHGARVTAVSRDLERGQRLLELGAEQVVASVAATTGPFDIALESTGGSALAEVWVRMTPHGHVVWFGQASRTPPTVDFLDWRGATSGTLRKFLYLEDETPVCDDLAALVRLLSQRRIEVEIGLRADWSETGAALEALVNRQVLGNAVLTISRP
jgi:NADPH:quinone reductase